MGRSIPDADRHGSTSGSSAVDRSGRGSEAAADSTMPPLAARPPRPAAWGNQRPSRARSRQLPVTVGLALGVGSYFLGVGAAAWLVREGYRLGGFFPGPSLGRSTALLLARSLVGALLVGALLALLMRYLHHRSPTLMGMTFAWRSMSTALAGFAVPAAVTFVDAWPLHAPPVDTFGGWTSATWHVALVLVLPIPYAVQAIAGELAFRGYVLHLLATRPRVAIWSSILLFCLANTSLWRGLSWWDHVVESTLVVGAAVLATALTAALRSLGAGVGVFAGIHLADVFPLLGGDAASPMLVGVGCFLVGITVLIMTHARAELNVITFDPRQSGR